MMPLVPHTVADERVVFRFQSRAVLLTYQGIDAVEAEALKVWTRFLHFVQSNKRTWGRCPLDDNNGNKQGWWPPFPLDA
jgi:hypothetical protein